MRSFEAYTPAGRLVFTFGSRDLAMAYVNRMKAVGCEITLKIARVERRKAA